MLGEGNSGLNLELIGYGTSFTVLQNLRHLPFVYAFVKREPDAPFLDTRFEFEWRSSESTFLANLKKALFATKADATATLQILMQYYKTALKRSEKKFDNLPTSTTATDHLLESADDMPDDPEFVNKMSQAIKSELNDVDLAAFAQFMDRDCPS
jgi:hypothetical protein